jgi:ribosomal protein S18 acetylase RimI-like enzyme
MESVLIHPANLFHAAQIADLVTQLGYPTSTEQMRARLGSILADDEYATLVASHGGRVLGFVGTRINLAYENDGLVGQIMVMAVASDSRRNGVGSGLLHAAERGLIERGARVLVLSPGNHRDGAHAFYEANGYAFTGRRYRKTP